MITWFTILVLALVTFLTVYLIYHYPTKQTPIHVKLFVGIGWFTSFIIVTLIPFDVSLALGAEGDEHFLYMCWKVIYWTVFCLCWFFMPILMNYHQAGEFTVLSKLQKALFVYIRYHVILAAVGGALLLYAYIAHGLTLTDITAFLIIISNCWGLILIITLLGYGLVAIPRSWWNYGNLEHALDYVAMKAFFMDEALIEAKYQLDQHVGMIMSLDKQIVKETKLREWYEIMLSICPEESLQHNRAISGYRVDSKEVVNEKKLIKINLDLKKLISNYIRTKCRWEELLKEAFHIQDIVNNKKNPEKKIESAFWSKRAGKLGRSIEVSEWLWFCWINPILARVIALLLYFASIWIIVGESTLFIDTPVAAFPILFEHEYGDEATQILCFFILLYIIVSTYLALFKLKLGGKFGLYAPRLTDPPNLLWCATFMARLVAPLSYNFLLLIKVTDTQFNKVMKNINLIPIFGSGFAMYVPLLLLVFCLMNFFNIHTKIMASLGMSQFSFGDKYDKEKLKEGQALIKKFRAEKERKGVSPSFASNAGYFQRIATGGLEEQKASFVSVRSERRGSARAAPQYEETKKLIPDASETLKKPKRDIYDF
ncbi:LMBRD2_5 [Blepharisma stoltei]|uniref:LMBR1 domain-containing protein 2 n=1 Tax=Blepharisma stoltei TaxID=1481888 RepID=A0AAU9JXE9_9CILI|nr:unnamed protein product [Blepharisma stoltei]